MSITLLLHCGIGMCYRKKRGGGGGGISTPLLLLCGILMFYSRGGNFPSPSYFICIFLIVESNSKLESVEMSDKMAIWFEVILIGGSIQGSPKLSLYSTHLIGELREVQSQIQAVFILRQVTAELRIVQTLSSSCLCIVPLDWRTAGERKRRKQR